MEPITGLVAGVVIWAVGTVGAMEIHARKKPPVCTPNRHAEQARKPEVHYHFTIVEGDGSDAEDDHGYRSGEPGGQSNRLTFRSDNRTLYQNAGHIFPTEGADGRL